MRVEGLALNLIPTKSAVDQSLVRALEAGQIVKATVAERVAAGTVTLKIGDVEVPVKTVLALAKGETLALRVDKQGGQPVLQIVQRQAPPPSNPMPTNPNPVITVKQAITTALRDVLPKQLPPATTLDALNQLVRAVETAPGKPEFGPLMALIKRLIASLPEPRDVSRANGLSRATQNSGTFLEAKLEASANTVRAPAARVGAAVGDDLKANLSIMVATAKNASKPDRDAGLTHPATPADARGLVERSIPNMEAALDRILVNQLRSVPTSEVPNPPLVVEVPVKSPPLFHTVKMSIERDGGRDDSQEQQNWSVTLWLDFEPLGPIGARINLSGPRVSVLLFAEREQAVALLSQRIGELHDNLSRAGLDVEAIRCKPQKMPAEKPLRTHDLIDVSA